MVLLVLVALILLIRCGLTHGWLGAMTINAWVGQAPRAAAHLRPALARDVLCVDIAAALIIAGTVVLHRDA